MPIPRISHRTRLGGVSRNLGSAVLARAASLVASAGSVPILLNHMGVDQYGVYILVTGIAGLLPFADLGLGMYLVARIARARAEADWQTVQSDIANALGALLACAMASSLALITVSQWVNFARLLPGGTSEEQFQTALLVFSITYLLGMPFGLCQRILTGIGSAHLANYWFAAATLTGLLATFIGARLNFGLVALAALPALVPLIGNAAMMAYLFRWRPELRPRLDLLSLPRLSAMLKPSAFFALVACADAFNFAVDPYIVASHLTNEAVATYSVTSKLFAQPALILSLATMFLLSNFGRDWEAKRLEQVRRNLNLMTIACAAGGLGAAVVLYAVAKPLIQLWTGGAVPVDGLLLLACATWCFLVAAETPILMFLNGAGFARFRALTSTCMAGANVGLGLLLTPVIGTSGPMFASIIANLAFVALPSVLYTRHLLARRSRPMMASVEHRWP